MFYTIFDLKKDMDRKLRAGGVSQLENFFSTVDEGRRNLIGKVRPEELIRNIYLEQAVFPHVDTYAVPEDLKYDDVIELKKLSADRNVDTMVHPAKSVYRRRFDQKRGGARNIMNIGYTNGIKYAKVYRPRGLHECQQVIIHRCDSLTQNGTWNVGGNVVNLRSDEINYVSGRGSLAFDINNSSNFGFIENFTLESFDLADFFKKGAVFSWLNFPIAKEIVSVTLILGSNTSNLTTDLYTATVNMPHNNSGFVDGWNLLKYMMENLTITGLPNPSDLKYVRLEFNTTGQPVPNCNLDLIIARKGVAYELTYNSSFLFRDAFTNAIKKKPTSDSDIIIAEEDTYQIFMLECSLAGLEEIYGNNASANADCTKIAAKLAELYFKYNMEHKSEAMLQEDSTYVFGNMYDGWTDESLPEGHFRDNDQGINHNQNGS